MNIVDRENPEDSLNSGGVIDVILNEKKMEEFTKEIDLFINRSKNLLEKYYEDLNTIDRLSGLDKNEFILSLRESPKRMQKYHK